LPEAHNCPKIDIVRMRSIPTVVRRSSLNVPKIRLAIGGVEVRHLLVAWLVLGLCFSLRYAFRTYAIFPLMFIISLGTAGAGFIIHELMHKFSAERYGFWAEFRLWPWGLVMALAFSFVSGGSFIFAAPGATYIIPSSYTFGSSVEVNRRQNGLISLAGPVSNVILAVVFFTISGFNGLLSAVGTIGFQVNLWLAAFNMIPFNGIDGRKVLSWSIPIWIAVAIPLWLMVAFQILG
jgi:Zn-dependent protease